MNEISLTAAGVGWLVGEFIISPYLCKPALRNFFPNADLSAFDVSVGGVLFGLLLLGLGAAGYSLKR